jgi:ABC-type transport system involved in multi-copper enzyme maturation permease subunit
MNIEDAMPDAPAAPDLAIHAKRRGESPLAGFLPVFQWGLRENLRLGRMLLLLGAAVALGALASMMVNKGIGPYVGTDKAFRLWHVLDARVMHILIPLIALLLVGPSYSREMRQRTLVYLLVRPVSRTTVFLARFASGVIPAALVACTLFVSVMLFSGVKVPATAWVGLLATACFGVLVLGAVYCTLATLFRRGLVSGLLYTFMFELVVASLPGNIQKFSINFHLSSLYHGLVDSAFAEESEGVRGALAGSDAATLEEKVRSLLVSQTAYDPPATAILILLCITAGVLALGVAQVRNRDFALKD